MADIPKITVSEHVPPDEIWFFNPPPVIRMRLGYTMEELADEYRKYWTRIINVGKAEGNDGA